MAMTLFDQPYYALTKALMSRMGIWPEQSKYVRIIVPSTVFVLIMTLIGPALNRLHDAWRDVDILVRSLTIFLMGMGIVFTMLHTIQHIDMIHLTMKRIEEHWEIFKNTPSVIVLDKYAERGRYLIVVYSTCTYSAMILFFSLCLSPVILDFVDPMNETRPKMYIIDVDYGVDVDKYYWCIIAHTYIVAAIAISMMIAFTTSYILGVVHVCALFEVVGFNLKLIANKHSLNKKNVISLRIDRDYKKITDCVVLHAEAISFAGLLEDLSTRPSGMILVVIAIITVISGVQALLKWKQPEVLIQQITLVIGQIIHLYMVNIPGQELMNHSGKIHTTAYNLNWPDMAVNTQKLLIPILMRSNKPCCFTAGKFFVLSMETFGSEMRIMISYFTIFAQMI